MQHVARGDVAILAGILAEHAVTDLGGAVVVDDAVDDFPPLEKSPDRGGVARVIGDDAVGIAVADGGDGAAALADAVSLEHLHLGEAGGGLGEQREDGAVHIDGAGGRPPVVGPVEEGAAHVGDVEREVHALGDGLAPGAVRAVELGQPAGGRDVVGLLLDGAADDGEGLANPAAIVDHHLVFLAGEEESHVSVEAGTI